MYWYNAVPGNDVILCVCHYIRGENETCGIRDKLIETKYSININYINLMNKHAYLVIDRHCPIAYSKRTNCKHTSKQTRTEQSWDIIIPTLYISSLHYKFNGKGYIIILFKSVRQFKLLGQWNPRWTACSK